MIAWIKYLKGLGMPSHYEGTWARKPALTDINSFVGATPIAFIYLIVGGHGKAGPMNLPD